MFCLDKAFSFMFDEENLRMAAGWINSGKVEINGEDLEAKLTEDQKYTILQNFYSSPSFDTDTKKELKEKALASDNSDKASKVVKICEQSLPDAEQKARIWAAITDVSSSESLESLQIKIQGFFKRNQQLDLISPYFVKFFDVLGEVIEKRDREFAQVFCYSLSPAFMAREQEENAFREFLRNPAYQDRDFFINFLKKQMETIETVRKSRALCTASMLD